MKKMSILLVVLAALMLCIGAATEKKSYKDMTGSFMAGIILGEVNKSCDTILLNSHIKESQEKVDLLNVQITSTINLYGKPFGYEFIKEQKYGDSIVRLVYISKMEKIPLTWEFYFYKAASDWKLIGLNYNDKHDLLADK